MDPLAANFIAYSRQKLADNHAQIMRCVGHLSQDEVWRRANDHSNSIGNLLLHLRGNVMMWIVDGIGGRPYQRNRPAEFAQRDALPIAPIMSNLADAMKQVDAVLAALPEQALTQPHTIQTYTVTGLEAIYHVVEHYSLHTGQIITMTKAIKKCDVSNYDANGHRRDGRAIGAP